MPSGKNNKKRKRNCGTEIIVHCLFSFLWRKTKDQGKLCGVLECLHNTRITHLQNEVSDPCAQEIGQSDVDFIGQQ